MTEELTNKLNDVKKDPAKSFMNGQTTNVFQDTLKSAGSIVGAYAVGTGIYESITPELLQSLTIELTSVATQKITENATKLLADYTKAHLELIETMPSRLYQKTQDVFNDNKITLQEALSELTGIPIEDQIEEAKDKSNEKSKNNFVKNFQKTLTNINGFIDKYSSEASDKLEQLCQYIEAGPDFLEGQIDKQVKSMTKDIKRKLDDQTKKDQKAMDEFLDQQAENAGQALAEKFNKKIRDKAKDQRYKLDKAKTKTNQMVKVNKQKGILQMMGQFGL